MSNESTNDPGGPQRAIGVLEISDGDGVIYTFDAYPLRARPSVVGEVVYAFCRLEGSAPVPLFVGSTDILPERLREHVSLEPAAELGAAYLLVHRPDPDDTIAADAAALRIVRWHRPVLNGATANLAAWLPEPVAQQAASGTQLRPQG